VKKNIAVLSIVLAACITPSASPTAGAPITTADLQGTVWILDGLVQGEAVTSVSGDRATLEFFTDGSLIGSTGCRTITGSYVVSGAEVTFTDWAAYGECPASLATQDSRVISGLEGGFRVEIEGDTLTTWVTGTEGLIYKADSAYLR